LLRLLNRHLYWLFKIWLLLFFLWLLLLILYLLLLQQLLLKLINSHMFLILISHLTIFSTKSILIWICKIKSWRLDRRTLKIWNLLLLLERWQWLSLMFSWRMISSLRLLLQTIIITVSIQILDHSLISFNLSFNFTFPHRNN
jgi:hypothetical protein